MYVVNERPQLELCALLAIWILIANEMYELARNFKGLSQDGGWAKFYKNLPVFIFNKNLSNEPNFSRIHLSRQ
jgi:hypothetical protein